MSERFLHYQGREQLESAAVGCLLDDCQSATLSGSMPAPELYTDPRLKTIVEAICAMLARHEAVQSDTVAAELMARRLWGDIGAFFAGLSGKSVPSVFPALQAKLYEFADSDATGLIATELQEALRNGADPVATIADSLAALQAHGKNAALLTEAKPIRDVLRRAVDRYEKLLAGQTLGIPTGFFPIDNLGGLQPGEMVLICGQTGIGKSTLALNMLHAALKGGNKAAVFSLEMSDQAWIDRLISLDLRIDRRAFRSKDFFTQGVLQKIASNSGRLASLPIWLCDDASITIGQIRRILTRLAATAGIRLFVVDYTQLVAPAEGIESREQQVAGIGRGIRSICQELALVGLALSQLNDDGKVRESRALMHEANVAFVLEERADGNGTSLWVTTPKGRDMAVSDFPVDFDALTCRITQRSQVERSDRKLWAANDNE